MVKVTVHLSLVINRKEKGCKWDEGRGERENIKVVKISKVTSEVKLAVAPGFVGWLRKQTRGFLV